MSKLNDDPDFCPNIRETHEKMMNIMQNIAELLDSIPPEPEAGILSPTPQQYEDFKTSIVALIEPEFTYNFHYSFI